MLTELEKIVRGEKAIADLLDKGEDLLPAFYQQLMARLDAIIAGQAAQTAVLNQVKLLLEGTPSPTALLYSLKQGDLSMIVTSAALTAGGTLDQINVVDQNGVVLAPSMITWSPPAGEASPTDLAFVISADNMGFNFTASATAPTEAVTLFATWTDPTGVAAPVSGGQFTFNITGVGPAAPTAVQYDEVLGA